MQHIWKRREIPTVIQVSKSGGNNNISQLIVPGVGHGRIAGSCGHVNKYYK
jgi:hypothetical protein